MSALVNLRSLRDDMRSKGENFDIFDFSYNGKSYFVIVKVFDQKDKPKHALVKLVFLRVEDVADKFEAWANVNGLDRKSKDIRNYFHIPYHEGGVSDALQRLYKALGSNIPTIFNKKRKDDSDKNAALSNYVISSDPTDPNKKYCFGVMKTGGRSPFNDEKTQLLRKNLYIALGDIKELSFLYSTDPSKEKDDPTIIQNYYR
ncbi:MULTISPECIES: DUF6037 family protein [unclassified Lysinibacillus]|uniref:DUF6037 family protein n=1 Tax=unclassified Lysinibacillus TaxID=2636778 RepID=UPI0035DF3CEA